MSILAQLELNEASEVDFGIEIHGTTEASSEIRFIIEGPQYGILCKCVDNNGVITASIPKLKGILPAGTFDARLEVVVDGKFFTPLSESIEFKPLVEFDVTSTKAKPAQVMKVETKNVRVRVIEEPAAPVVQEETVIQAPVFVAPVAVKPVIKPAPIPEPVVEQAPVIKPAPIPEPVVQLLPEDLEESWNEQIETQAEETIEPVEPVKKKTVNPRAKELYAKIRALKEQISTVRK